MTDPLLVELPAGLNEGDELEGLVGSLVSYRKGIGLEEEGKVCVPNECCMIKSTKGPALVEAYDSGLFLALPGKAKQKISAGEFRPIRLGELGPDEFNQIRSPS